MNFIFRTKRNCDRGSKGPALRPLRNISFRSFFQLIRIILFHFPSTASEKFQEIIQRSLHSDTFNTLIRIDWIRELHVTETIANG